MTGIHHVFDGESLTIAQVAALAAGPARCDLSAEAWSRVKRGRAIVERAAASGEAIYGATTGVGSQKDFTVRPERIAGFNRRMILAEATDLPGETFAATVLRAALVVRINAMATGALGVSHDLVRRNLLLLAANDLPRVRSGASFGISDLGPLAQLSLPLVGDDPEIGGVLALKEACSLINNNSVALGHAALVIEAARGLIEAFDLAAAVSLEGFGGNLAPYGDGGAATVAHTGHAASRQAIGAALAGSTLWHGNRTRLLQDPLSFRFAAPVNGAVRDMLALVVRVVEAEINTGVDNPVVDLGAERLRTGVAMDSTLLTLGFDGLRQALTRMAELSTERANKLQWSQFSGLPVGLAAADGPEGGVQTLLLNHLAAARLGAMRPLAGPVLLDYRGLLGDGIEDTGTLAPLAIGQTERALEIGWVLAGLEASIAVWAIARRGIPGSALGTAVRGVYEAVRPLLPIDAEGDAVFDAGAAIEAFRRTAV
jgi:histidine ammonia-lyase